MHTRWMVAIVVGTVVGGGLLWAPRADAKMSNEVKIYAGPDEKPVTLARIMPDEYEIGVGGTMFLRIRGGAAGFSAAERARIVNTRLTYILSYADVDPDAVRIEPVRGKPTIYVGDVRLITVYPSDVEAAGASSMGELANIWAAATACCLRNVAPWPRIQAEM